MDDATPKLDLLLKRIPSVKTFCCVIDVDTGTIIVAFLGLISAVIWTVIDVIYLSIIYDLLPLSNDCVLTIERMEGVLIWDLLIHIMLTVSFFFLVLRYKEPLMVRWWLLSCLLLTVAKILSAALYAAFKSFFMFIISVFYAGFHVYYFLVVNTYYNDMDDGGRHF